MERGTRKYSRPEACKAIPRSLVALLKRGRRIPWLLELQLDVNQDWSPKKPMHMPDLAIAMASFILSMLISQQSDMSEQFCDMTPYRLCIPVPILSRPHIDMFHLPVPPFHFLVVQLFLVSFSTLH